MISLKAIIFDMDGLLIDSEPLWKEAEIQVFNDLGVPMTEEMCREVTGLRIDEVIAHWYKYYPWKGDSLEQVQERIISQMKTLILKKGKALPGVPAIFEFFKAKNIPMVIASSSSFELIHTVVEKLKIGHYLEFVHSAEVESHGKPHPAIFLTAAKKLGVAPTDCLVFEDSFFGVLAGKAARMKVIAVPEKNDKRFAIADLVLDTLEGFGEENWLAFS